MPIQIRCPRGHAITVPRRRAGTKIRCPICSSVTEVPQIPEEPEEELEAPPVAAPPPASKPTTAPPSPPAKEIPPSPAARSEPPKSATPKPSAKPASPAPGVAKGPETPLKKPSAAPRAETPARPVEPTPPKPVAAKPTAPSAEKVKPAPPTEKPAEKAKPAEPTKPTAKDPAKPSPKAAPAPPAAESPRIEKPSSEKPSIEKPRGDETKTERREETVAPAKMPTDDKPIAPAARDRGKEPVSSKLVEAKVAEAKAAPPSPAPVSKSEPAQAEAPAAEPAPIIAARTAPAEPPALPKMPSAAAPPPEPEEIVLPPPLPHELQEDLPGMEHHPEELWPVYYVAIALGALALFSLGPVVMELVSWYRAIAEMEVTAGLGFWVWVVLMASLLELGYAVYLAQLPDWSSLWVVTLVAVVIAAGYAGGLGLMMLANKDSALVRDLGLAFLRETRSGISALWCLCLMSLGGMLSYFSGSLSWQWSRRSLALLTATTKQNPAA